jgi:hypothetical protein
MVNNIKAVTWMYSAVKPITGYSKTAWASSWVQIHVPFAIFDLIIFLFIQFITYGMHMRRIIV